jgi:predicted AAA+ superfamily ATPase
MKRIIDYHLSQWQSSPIRKPLIMRGARQVGKTHAVRTLGKKFTNMVEVNFEKQPELCELFAKNLDPIRIINALSATTEQPITPGKTLLFFDEVQTCRRAITALRYFYEELPELHVIAAGSLLDFAIQQEGVPVGRVTFCHMHPVSFIEFVAATGHHQLLQHLLTHSPTIAIETVIHQKLFELLGEYFLLGGMPEVIQEWVTHKNYLHCAALQRSILATYQQDFPKYAKKMQIKYLDLLFKRVPHLVCEPFKYSHIDQQYKKRELEPALQLLIQAGVIHKVEKTAANGVPLGAEVDFKHFKLLLLDIALTQIMLGNNLQSWLLDPVNSFINKGAITEAFVGQEMLAYANPTIENQLYYWQRTKRTSNAEVDYLVQMDTQVIPIEVKSGKGSTLKSLHMFLENKANAPYGLRFSIHNFSQTETLHSYPLYAIALFFAQQDSTLHASLNMLIH